jgi:ketosteroid isomerase-like protein
MLETPARIAVVALFLLGGCASMPSSRSVVTIDEKAIREARIAQNRAIAVSDLASVERFWTEDVTVRRALGIPVAGRAEARKAFEITGPRDSTVIYQRTTTAVELSIAWPLAFETGTWTGQLRDLFGPTVISGRFSAQWVKRDGHWLIRSEVFVPLACGGVGCTYRAVP